MSKCTGCGRVMLREDAWSTGRFIQFHKPQLRVGLVRSQFADQAAVYVEESGEVTNAD